MQAVETTGVEEVTQTMPNVPCEEDVALRRLPWLTLHLAGKKLKGVRKLWAKGIDGMRRPVILMR